MLEYRDIADEDEDERIRLIGEMTMTIRRGETIGFITQDQDGKLERYIEKLQKRFPGIRVIGRGRGPVEGVAWAKVSAPVN